MERAPRVKGLLLALAATALASGLVTLRLRSAPPGPRVPLLVQTFAVTAMAYLVGFALTPDDLGALPPALVEHERLAEALFGLSVHLALCFGGILQIYNLAERGFSLRVLIEIATAPGGALDAKEIAARYGGGQGLGWMLEKRIRDMVGQGLIRPEGDGYRATAHGTRSARVLGGLRRFLRLDPRVRAGDRA
jgi:hypothetical protein